MTGLAEIEFQKLLAYRGVDLNYSEADLAQDLETIARGI